MKMDLSFQDFLRLFHEAELDLVASNLSTNASCDFQQKIQYQHESNEADLFSCLTDLGLVILPKQSEFPDSNFLISLALGEDSEPILHH